MWILFQILFVIDCIGVVADDGNDDDETDEALLFNGVKYHVINRMVYVKYRQYTQHDEFSIDPVALMLIDILYAHLRELTFISWK